MLVLSRKVGEAIMIGDSIRITISEIRGGRVRLGIVAPDDVSVDREEIHDKRKNPLNGWAEPELWSRSWTTIP